MLIYLVSLKVAKNMKRIILICSILIPIIAVACNVCDNSGTPAETKPSELYFTAKLLNSSTTAVYGANKDGSELKVILNDCELHCAPSQDGKLIILKGVSIGLQTVDLFDIKTGKLREMLSSANNNYKNPGITPNGKKAFAQVGFDKIIIIDLITNAQKELVYKINHQTIPAFSPNSEMLAILEDSDDNINRILKVVSTNNPDDVLSNITIPYQIDSNNSYFVSRLNWSSDSKYIYFSVKVADVNKVARINLTNNTSELLDFGNLSAFEPLPVTDNKYIAFVDMNGSLQKAVPNSNGNYTFSYLVKVSLDERCRYQSFNKSESALIYSKSNKNSSLQFASNLYVADMNSGNSRYLFSNVNAGFWYP